MRRGLGTLALLAVFAGLALYTVYRPTDRAAPTKKIYLLASDDARARAIWLKTTSGEVRLERRVDRSPAWWIVAPIEAPVRRRFSPSLDVWIKAARAKQKVDSARKASSYGLDPAALEVRVELDDGRKLGLLIGDEVPVALTEGEGVKIKYFYVRKPGEDAIYTMPSAGVVEVLREGVEGMRNDAPFDFEPEEVASVSFSGASGLLLEVRRKGDVGEKPAWEVTLPAGGKADAVEIEEWLWRITRVRARVFPAVAGGEAGLGRLGLNRSASSLSFRLRTVATPGRTPEVTVLIGGTSADGGLRYLKKLGDPSIYAIEGGEWDYITSTAFRIAHGL